MSVIQISKIQVRRGRKLSDIGVPQLSSAEFAWAVDTQELFIGNGSIAEGAPYVGNTKILTEHDNILELANSYRFGSNNLSIINSQTRPLQDKLDETVSILDFGAVPDGVTDCLAAFELAFSTLYGPGIADKYRKILLIPNGVYTFSGNLKIPSKALIRGETKEKSILNIAGNNILFTTTEGLEVVDFTSTNRPSNVEISNLTIQQTTGEVVITGVGDSVFSDIKFIGTYEIGDLQAPLSNQPASVSWEDDDDGTKVTNFYFKDCQFLSTSLAVKAVREILDINNPPNFDTFVNFENCKFFVCGTAIAIIGIPDQGNKWQIRDCEFEEIANQAFIATAGRGTVIERSRFINCGNGATLPQTPVTSIISFGDSIGNSVISCSSNRSSAFNDTQISLSQPGIVEVENSSRTSLIDINYNTIYRAESPEPLAVFSAFNRYTYIDYSLNLGEHTRSGRLVIMVNDSRTDVSITDNFTYSSPLVTSTGGIYMSNFIFYATLRDNFEASAFDTVVLSYENRQSDSPPLPSLGGTITYTVSYGV